MTKSAPHITFFGHNSKDAAVKRRIAGFKGAGFKVTGIMPHRGAAESVDFDLIDLGETYDNAYFQRLFSLFSSIKIIKKEAALCAETDLFYARNLDMLMLAVRVRKKLKLDVPIVYECLDVHHRLTQETLSSKILRRLERWLLGKTALLIVSSPRFETDYFRKYHAGAYDFMVLENRLILNDQLPPSYEPKDLHLGKLKLGWFGNLRCRRSFNVLQDLTEKFQGRIEVVLRGYPARSVFPNFENEVHAAPYLNYYGPYQSPQDLPRIYSEIDLAWAGDWYESGANSLWLLPNRLYESGYYATVALAPEGTETANWLQARSAGLIIKEPIGKNLEEMMAGLLKDQSPILKCKTALVRLPQSHFIEPADVMRQMFERSLSNHKSKKKGV